MGEGLQKDPGFSGFLVNEECAAAAHHFAESDLHERAV
jgi:hypothetical protein